MIAVVRFDGMIPLPGSDEHVSGFFASDGWALSEVDGKLVVEGHDKRYAFVGYAYGVVEAAEPAVVEPEPVEPTLEPRTGKRRRG